MGIIKKRNPLLNGKTKNIKHLKSYIKKNNLKMFNHELKMFNHELKINIEKENEDDILLIKEKNKANKAFYLLNRYCLDISLFAFFLNKLYFIFLFNFFSNFYIIPNYHYYIFLGFEVILFFIYLYLIKKLSFVYSYYMLIYNSITIIIITLFFSKTIHEKSNYVIL